MSYGELAEEVRQAMRHARAIFECEEAVREERLAALEVFGALAELAAQLVEAQGGRNPGLRKTMLEGRG